MNIVFLPLHGFGYADLNTNHVFISTKLSYHEKLRTIYHEIAHLLSRSVRHDEKWIYTFKRICPSSFWTPFFCNFDENIGNVAVGNMAGNIGNVTGIQNLLTDYHLLMAYRKFSSRILGTEGRWEVQGNNKIRLIPTPRGSFPVVVEYIPRVYQFRSPQAREITKRMIVAEAKIMLGHARGKFGNIPSPGGGAMVLNGESLRTEGMQEKQHALDQAILLGEPLGIHMW